MYKYIKRLLDLIISIIALVLLSPLYIITGILVCLKLGWPFLFKQERPGKDGKPFYLYKFRSMTDKKDEKGNLLPNEERLTPFGKRLRSTSLDELPSLFNVIKGDISLVGPRPLRMKYLPYFSPEQYRRHEVKPGITGYAQVNGRNKITWEEKFALDVWYVENQGLWLDVKILFKTVWNVINKKDITPGNQEFELPFDEYIIKARKVMQRKDQQLSASYKKNQRFELVISSMNQELEKAQNNLLFEIGENHPTIHILGAPRSGTTMVSQLIPSYLPVGHINNLIAAFWKAPIYGIELSKKLIQEEYKSNFKSDFGRTTGINEPHEFGYFWNYHLKCGELAQKNKDHEENIDWDYLTTVIKNMTYSYGKPIVFKSFLLGFHAHAFYKSLPKSCFIYIKRDLTDNVLSILKLREQLNGDRAVWGSIKPKQVDELQKLNIYEQVVGQVLCLEHEYLKQLELIPENNKMICSYEEICQNPKSFLADVKNKFLDKKQFDLKSITPFERRKSSVKPEVETEILKAVETIYNLFPYIKHKK